MLSDPCFSWDLCFPSADGGGDSRRGRGGPASPKALLVTGRGPRRVPRPQRNGQTDPQRALRDRVRTELQWCRVTPQQGSAYTGPRPALCPLPTPAQPGLPVCHGEPDVPSYHLRGSVREICGERGQVGRLRGPFLPGQCVPGTCHLRDHRLGGGGGGGDQPHGWRGWAGQNQPRGRGPFS